MKNRIIFKFNEEELTGEYQFLDNKSIIEVTFSQMLPFVSEEQKIIFSKEDGCSGYMYSLANNSEYKERFMHTLLDQIFTLEKWK